LGAGRVHCLSLASNLFIEFHKYTYDNALKRDGGVPLPVPFNLYIADIALGRLLYMFPFAIMSSFHPTPTHSLLLQSQVRHFYRDGNIAQALRLLQKSLSLFPWENEDYGRIRWMILHLEGLHMQGTERDQRPIPKWMGVESAVGQAEVGFRPIEAARTTSSVVKSPSDNMLLSSKHYLESSRYCNYRMQIGDIYYAIKGTAKHIMHSLPRVTTFSVIKKKRIVLSRQLSISRHYSPILPYCSETGVDPSLRFSKEVD